MGEFVCQIGESWYFLDAVKQPYGPFKSEEKAEAELKRYVQWLQTTQADHDLWEGDEMKPGDVVRIGNCWYFVDETSRLSGKFETEEEAKEFLEHYTWELQHRQPPHRLKRKEG
jgi:hypothetical protein